MGTSINPKAPITPVIKPTAALGLSLVPFRDFPIELRQDSMTSTDNNVNFIANCKSGALASLVESTAVAGTIAGASTAVAVTIAGASTEGAACNTEGAACNTEPAACSTVAAACSTVAAACSAEGATYGAPDAPEIASDVIESAIKEQLQSVWAMTYPYAKSKRATEEDLSHIEFRMAMTAFSEWLETDNSAEGFFSVARSSGLDRSRLAPESFRWIWGQALASKAPPEECPMDPHFYRFVSGGEYLRAMKAIQSTMNFGEICNKFRDGLQKADWKHNDISVEDLAICLTCIRLNRRPPAMDMSLALRLPVDHLELLGDLRDSLEQRAADCFRRFFKSEALRTAQPTRPPTTPPSVSTTSMPHHHIGPQTTLGRPKLICRVKPWTVSYVQFMPQRGIIKKNSEVLFRMKTYLLEKPSAGLDLL